MLPRCRRTAPRSVASRFLRLLIIVALALPASLGTPVPAHAATFTVTTTTDAAHTSPLNGSCTSTLAGNPCTLRAAMQAANFLGGGPHTITVPAGTYTLTIAGSDDAAAVGDLDVAANANIAIVGAGALSTIIQAGRTPGSGIDRVFDIAGGGKFSGQDLTIRHGRSTRGGGLHMRPDPGQAIVILDRVIVSNNAVTASITGEGGGIYNENGRLTVTNSAFIANAADDGSAHFGNTSQTTLTNVTVSGNTATVGARSTVVAADLATVMMRNVTIVGNQGHALNGGGLTISNSIIAGNSEGCAPFVFPSASAGHNLMDTGDCPFTATGDRQNTDPQLGPLLSSGYHVPLPGSPAIDAGNPGTPGGADPSLCAATDQRGVTRPQDGDLDGTGRCDIGAVEVPRFVVNSTTDALDAGVGDLTCRTASRVCTLRAAVMEANALGSAAVSVPAGGYALSIPGAGEDQATRGDLDISQGLTLAGSGRVVIDGRGLDRVFDILGTARAVLRGVAIQGGNPGSSLPGGGVRVGGQASLTLTESALLANTAGSGGGLASSGTLQLTNVTLSGNKATGQGGGLLATGGLASLLNTTVASNTASSGGGVARTGGTLTLKNTLLGTNSGGNCAGTIVSSGNNLDSANTCNLNSVLLDGDVINADPKLGPLQDNGGGTPTHALLSSSPAIDRGTNNGCPKFDQRLLPRPKDGDSNASTVACDIGAFEVQPGAVGTFALAPADATVTVGQRHAAVLTWTVPPPATWKDLKTVQVRLREQDDDDPGRSAERGQDEAAHVALQFEWDQGTNTVRLVDPKTGGLGPPASLGSDTVLKSARAALHLKDSSITGGGPTAPDVAFNMNLEFHPPSKGRTYLVEVAATNDAGDSQSFAPAGTIAVAR